MSVANATLLQFVSSLKTYSTTLHLPVLSVSLSLYLSLSLSLYPSLSLSLSLSLSPPPPSPPAPHTLKQCLMLCLITFFPTNATCSYHSANSETNIVCVYCINCSVCINNMKVFTMEMFVLSK